MKGKRNFPLFSSHLDLAHSFWEKHLSEGSWAIDATCGNGHDTLKLAKIVGPKGGVIAIDVQKEAIEGSKNLLAEHGQSAHFVHGSHEEFPQIVRKHPIELIVYNLGYLPGSDKSLTTRVDTTLKSLQAALDLLQTGGVISITCYRGHPEGAREEGALLSLTKALPKDLWCVSHISFRNRDHSPSLLLIQKNSL